MTDPLRKSPEGSIPAEHQNNLDQSDKEVLIPTTEVENQEVVSSHQEEGESSPQQEGEQPAEEDHSTSIESVLEPQDALEHVSDSAAQDKIMSDHLLKDSSGLDNASAAHKLLLDIMNPEA